MAFYSERTVRWFHQSYTIDEATGCHIWRGRVHLGKAVFSVGERKTTARRAAYAVAYGELPAADVKINVTCNQRLCVNVEHFVLSRKSLLVGEGQKYCSRCKEIKPLTAFSPCKTGAGAVFNYCRPCFQSYKKHAYDRDPEVKFLSRLRTYGLTREGYDRMYEEQDGKCAICGEIGLKHGLAIDHDGPSGMVRQLLCNRCNGGIALLMHDPAIIRQALAYIETWGQVIAARGA